MKRLGLILASLIATLAMAPKVSAAPIDMTKYISETLEETFVEENLTYDFVNGGYSDTGDKVTIYVFRKNGCGQCRSFYNFVNDSLLSQYADKFKVVSYELSNNAVNFGLLNQLAEFYNQKSTDGSYGTPVVIVGDTMTTGAASISSARKQEIIDIVKSGTDYDVIEEIADGINNINDSMKTTFTDGGATLVTNTPYYRSHTLRTAVADASGLGLDRYEYISAYDVDLMNGGVVVPISGAKLTISLPVNKTYKSYKVAYISGGQISEVLDASYNNGTVTFDTSHLSRYAIYGSNEEVVANTDTKKIPLAPNSGVKYSNSAAIMAMMIAVTIAGGVGIYCKKRQ